MGIKEKLIRLSEVRDEAQVTLRGSRELCAENCRCITACDENLAVLSMEGLTLRVTGTGLSLENFGAFGVKITGKLHSLTVEEQTP